MDVLEAIQTRRSIRHFDPNYTIPKEDLHKIVDLTLLSPTAMNKQGIDLVVVTNRQKIDEATEILSDQSMQEHKRGLLIASMNQVSITLFHTTQVALSS